jgi:protein subunit release factor B
MKTQEDNRQRIRIVSKADLDISFFVGPGHGGQKKQKTHSGCQIIHRASGAIGRCSENRSQEQNKHAAFKNLLKTAKMKIWLSKKIYEIREQETLEEAVEKSMTPENLRFEIKNDGKWTEVNIGYFNTEDAKKEIN